MSQPKNTPEQLLANARALPTELSLARVGEIVAQFPPDSEPPAGFGHTPKILLLMLLLSVFTAGLYFLVGSPLPVDNDQLSGAFPAETPSVVEDRNLVAEAGEVVAPALAPSPAPIAASPSVNEVPASIRKSSPPLKTAPSVPSFAPATAPSAAGSSVDNLSREGAEGTSTPTENTGPESELRAPAPNTLAPSRYLATGPQDDPIEGRYSQKNKRLTLYKSVRIRGRKITWVLPFQLTPLEQRQLDEEGFMERETGRLSLSKGQDGITQGDFTFQPRSEVRAGYEQRGWGTSQAPAEEVNMEGIVKGLPMAKPVYTEEPAELLWLRYFITGVDNGYLGILKDLGFRESSFRDLWRLPNESISKASLLELANDVRRISPLYRGSDLEELVAFHKGRRLLEKLYDLGYRDVTPAEIRSLTEAKVFPVYLTTMNQGQPEPVPLADIVRYRQANIYSGYPIEMEAAFGRDLSVEEVEKMHAAKFFAANLQRMQRDGFRDLSVEEYLELHLAPRKVASKLLEDGDGLIVDANYARSGRVKQTETRRLGKFRTLVVDRDISVVVIPDGQNRAEVGLLVKPDWLKIKIKRSRGGKLTIKKKTKFGVSIKGMIQAEVRLYASDLEKIVVDETSRVFVVGDVEKYETYGPVGKAVLVE
ncbi:hypothetical protein [Lewinella sp. 4G2]|uniref:hypothetical protein n=1 Tax=Lewinella sp. 4G2 TaxID=1803372 RepID=UPI0007B4AC9B|nr:hypothetical protein [Lewinella sp. 4G2]OAV43749.1 hypothetical protein A3850_004220 [Lewinella sp. 4G2]